MTPTPPPDASTDARIGNLLVAVEKLTEAVGSLTKAHARRRAGNAVIGTLVVAMAVMVSLYYFVELPDRREAAYQDKREAACDVRDNGEPAHSASLRSKYNCPPLAQQRAARARQNATSRPSAPASTAPGSTSTRTRAVRVPGPTVTRTVAVPQARAAATRTKTAVRTVQAPRPAPSTVTVTREPICVVLKLVCR